MNVFFNDEIFSTFHYCGTTLPRVLFDFCSKILRLVFFKSTVLVTLIKKHNFGEEFLQTSYCANKLQRLVEPNSTRFVSATMQINSLGFQFRKKILWYQKTSKMPFCKHKLFCRAMDSIVYAERRETHSPRR